MNVQGLVKAVMAFTVAAVAGVAARVSFQHTVSVAVAAGEDRTTAALLPITTDGLIVAAGLVLLDAARSGTRPPRLARLMLGLGIAATLAVNVLHGIAHGVVGGAVSAWPALAFTFTSELGLLLIRASGRPVESDAAETASAAPALPTGNAPADWLPARMPARPAAAASAPARPATVTALVAQPAMPAPVDDRTATVRGWLADDPDLSGAGIASRLGVSERTGRRLRAAALDSDS